MNRASLNFKVLQKRRTHWPEARWITARLLPFSFVHVGWKSVWTLVHFNFKIFNVLACFIYFWKLNNTFFLVSAIFTVMCYNVLCDKYCTRQQYGYCPSWGLNWEYRKKGIMDEIRQCAADIIGLQVNAVYRHFQTYCLNQFPINSEYSKLWL